MSITIEKGVEIHASLREPGRQNPKVVEVSGMQPGDSFVLENGDHKLLGSYTYAMGRAGFKAATRKVEGGVRVWRTA